MANAWSSHDQWCQRKKVQTLTAQEQLIASHEHAAILEDPDSFDSLHRKDGFFDEGIATIFGVKEGKAEIQAFYFHPRRFTPVKAKQWLQERGIEPLLFKEGKS